MEYECAVCRKRFISEWSNDEALQELEENFPGYEESDCDVLCDECYKTACFYAGFE